jgi:hypothetical protein
MKYLKFFNESFNRDQLSLVNDIEYILMQIDDEGFVSNIVTPKTDNYIADTGELVRVYIEKPVFMDDDGYYETEPYKPTEIFIPALEHLFSFLRESKHRYSIELIGDGGARNNDTIAYSEFGENDMQLEEIFNFDGLINYIRIIIY